MGETARFELGKTSYTMGFYFLTLLVQVNNYVMCLVYRSNSTCVVYIKNSSVFKPGFGKDFVHKMSCI